MSGTYRPGTQWLISYARDAVYRVPDGLRRNVTTDAFAITSLHPAEWLAKAKQALHDLELAPYDETAQPKSVGEVVRIYSATPVPPGTLKRDTPLDDEVYGDDA